MSKFTELQVKLNLSIGFPGAEHNHFTFLHEHISEEAWNKLSFFAKQEFIEDEILNEWANDYIEKSAVILE